MNSPITGKSLKDWRKKAGLTQAEVAARLGLSQGVISRYESEETAIPLDEAGRLVRALELGVDLMVAEPARGFEAIDPKNPYQEYRTRLDLLLEFVESETPVEVSDAELQSLGHVVTLVRELKSLPRVLIAGRSDAGKSYVANCLLGRQILPTDYQPTTRIPIAVFHSGYKPDGVSGDCLLMRGPFDLGRLVTGKVPSQIVTEGDIALLSSRAIHVDADDSEPDEASWAVVFADCDILRACVIIDTPGFAYTESDSDKAMDASHGAEILIYCSPCTGCLDASDLVRLQMLLPKLPAPESIDTDFPKLGNFLFAVTQAAPHIPEPKLDGIRSRVAERFYRQCGELLEHRCNPDTPHPTPDQISERFTVFWGDMESRHREMRCKVADLLRTHFPSYRRKLADCRITEFRNQALSGLQSKIDGWKQFLDQWTEAKRRVEEIEANEPDRSSLSFYQRQKIEQEIERDKHDSLVCLDQCFNETVNPENIEREIHRTFISQDDARQGIGPLILQRIQTTVSNDLEHRSKALADRINDFLGTYAVRTSGYGAVSGSIDGAVAFDAFASFAAGLTGLATFGALAVWAAALGNLGGYIIVAKAVGLLAALGVSTGGVASVIAAVSAIGGPIVLGVALAIMAAITAFLMFWKSWQRRMAEKVCEQFWNAGLREQFREQIEKYWNDTRTAFGQAADAVERDYLAHIGELRKIADGGCREEIERKIQMLERTHDFFARLPWIPRRS